MATVSPSPAPTGVMSGHQDLLVGEGTNLHHTRRSSLCQRSGSSVINLLAESS